MISCPDEAYTNMKARYEYNLFDLDGTLTDPAPGITGSVMYALERMGFPVPPREELFKYIGPPLVYSFTTYAGMSEAQAQQAMRFYRERFSTGGLFENEIYPGIAELLKSIKSGGGRVILATGKPEEFAVQILEHFDILRYFDFVAGNTLEETRPEKRQVLEHIFAHFPQIGAKNTVMVGDRSYDAAAAAEYGIPSIGVLFGYGSREELSGAGAGFLAQDVRELSRLMLDS